jgi:spore maturation protein CgeB
MPTSRLWYINLFLPLQDLGHEVVPFDYDLIPHFRHLNLADPAHQAFVAANRPRLEQALLEQVEAAHRQRPVDLFFSYFYSAFCRPEVIQEIRRMGIITVNWYCNASYQFDMVKEIAPAYDYCLVPEKFRLDDYRRIGANPIYFQEAANPHFYKPYPSLRREFDVTFIGQKYGERPAYIRYLLEQGIDVKVFGWGWLPQPAADTSPHGVLADLRKLKRLSTIEGWRAAGRRLKRLIAPPPSSPAPVEIALPLSALGPPLSDEDMVKMYSRSKISLGFSTCGETHLTEQPIKQVRLRDFEAPMSGAFYMVEYMEELEEFFEIGKEIVCYHDKADLADKIKYYLAHEEEREQIRRAGHRRALADHTWQHRFARLFREIGLT